MHKVISIQKVDPVQVLGVRDCNLMVLQENFTASIIVRGTDVMINGEEEEVGMIERVFGEMMLTVSRKGYIEPNDVRTLIHLEKAGSPDREDRLTPERAILFTSEGAIRARSKGQERYVQAVAQNDITFAIGPAGTGKTYLAVAMAAASFKSRQVKRILLTRPAVEAGENLGFLPGDLQEKVEPYLTPLYDALYEMFTPEKVRSYLEQKVIEIAPLAYMRGRTLNNAFVILDEAQNTSALQMKMFLTRLGVNSKAIITGDITQIDLPSREQSGLVQIQSILKGIDGIEFIYLTDEDVVRHRLVREIIRAYSKFNGKEEEREEENSDV